MARSMTGFGRGTKDMEGKSFSIEMKSVNHRYLDINIKLPRNLISLEERIRKVVSQNLNRGKVDIFITQSTYSTNDVIANFNQSLADSYVKCLQEIKERYNVRDDISVSLVSRFPDVITLNQKEEDLEASWNAISSALNDAISNLLIMREKEGEKLRSDLEARCKYMKELVGDISKRAPLIVTSYKEKLEKRLAELLNDVRLDESRAYMEVAIFSDKSNIDEEIVRLYSHLNQMMDTLNLKEPIGRKLDFIIQEMNRETNTIGSKANDLELVNVVLNMKNEIEKIREQVQNIE
jgi:uncharacterized protein (TIGR00255 family)